MAGENSIIRKKNLPHYHSVHHKPHKDWPWIERGPP